MINTINAVDITINSTSSGGLKKAIETANNGDTILLQNGVYKGKNNTNIFINKSINIKGKGSKVVIDGERKNQIMVINENVKVSLSKLKFTNGRAMEELFDRASGAAIDSGGTITVNNCTFTNHKSSYAGAISIFGKCTIKNSKFINNSAVVNGGAIQSSSFSELTISKCTFKDNKANDGGGAIWSQDLTISTCTFTNNKAVNGGAIYSFGVLTVNKCSFKNNNGGAIYSIEKTIIKTSSFKNNKGSHGGAISGDGNMTVTSCNFTKNTAKYHGGAIYAHNELEYSPQYLGYLTVSKCIFNDNRVAMRGGAIFNKDFKTLKITNSQFKKNIAGKIYNAIFSEKGKISMKNVSLSPRDGTKVKK